MNTHIYIHVHIQSYAHIQVYTCICTFIHIHTYQHLQILVCVHMLNMHILIHKCLHMHAHTLMHTCAYTHILTVHIYILTNIHTHADVSSLAPVKTSTGPGVHGQHSCMYRHRDMQKARWEGSLLNQSPAPPSSPTPPGPQCPLFLGREHQRSSQLTVITEDSCLDTAHSRALSPLCGEPCPAVAGLWTSWLHRL